MKFTFGNPEKDFFEQNPELKFLDSSQKLLKLFDDAELVSKLRWAVYLIEDPNSKFHTYRKHRRVDLVNSNYLKEDYFLNFDHEEQKVVDDTIQFLFDDYADETMSKEKRMYYDREHSYQILSDQEKESTDLKLKADVQLKLQKIYQGLIELKELVDKELIEETRTRTRGKEQPGILFKK